MKSFKDALLHMERDDEGSPSMLGEPQQVVLDYVLSHDLSLLVISGPILLDDPESGFICLHPSVMYWN